MTVLEVGASQGPNAQRVWHLLDAAGVPAGVDAGAFIVDAAHAPDPAEITQLRSLAARHPSRMAIVVDCMDRVGCEYVVFAEYRQRLAELGLQVEFIAPAISETGEGIVSGSDRIEWFDGPTLCDWLKALARS